MDGFCPVMPKSAAKSPEQVYEERETLRELYEGLGQISEREQTYLLYRHGFTDDIEHTLIGAAIHFHLSESRTKLLENRSLDPRGGDRGQRTGKISIYLADLLK